MDRYLVRPGATGGASRDHEPAHSCFVFTNLVLLFSDAVDAICLSVKQNHPPKRGILSDISNDLWSRFSGTSVLSPRDRRRPSAGVKGNIRF